MAVMQTALAHATHLNYHRNAGEKNSTNAIDGDPSTYMRQYVTSLHDWLYYDGMIFPEIINWSNIKIVGYKIGILAATYWTTGDGDGLYIKLITEYPYTDSPTGITADSYDKHTAISNDIQILASGDTNDTLRWIYSVNTNENSAEIAWMNANKSKIANGKEFGFRVYGNNFKLAELGIILYYEPLSSNLYNGSKQASAIYGGSKQGEMYIGATKVL